MGDAIYVFGNFPDARVPYATSRVRYVIFARSFALKVGRQPNTYTHAYRRPGSVDQHARSTNYHARSKTMSVGYRYGVRD